MQSATGRSKSINAWTKWVPLAWIGAYDMLIAAHALSLGATLVTNNEREFKRVKGLRVENWVR